MTIERAVREIRARKREATADGQLKEDCRMCNPMRGSCGILTFTLCKGSTCQFYTPRRLAAVTELPKP